MSEGLTLDALVSLRRHPPASAYLSLVEAASFRAFGGYLGRDDLAVLWKAGLAGGAKNPNPDVIEAWSGARAEILAKAAVGQVKLYGRYAPRFGADPIGEQVPIPANFFVAERELVLGLTDTLYVENDPNRAMYYEIRVHADEFTRAFPAGKPTRAATAQEKDDIRAKAEQVRAERGHPPSEGELRDAFPQLSRSSVREVIHGLPTHLQRRRGQ